MKALTLAALVALTLTGCVTNVVTVGGGNTFTFSGNGNGVRTGQVMEQCANAVVALIAEHPEVDGDATFLACQKANGVTAI